MPKILKKLPKVLRRGKSPTYPWDEWLDGKIRRLKPNVDFQCNTHTLERMARAQARRRGMVLRFIREFVDATSERPHTPKGSHVIKSLTKNRRKFRVVNLEVLSIVLQAIENNLTQRPKRRKSS